MFLIIIIIPSVISSYLMILWDCHVVFILIHFMAQDLHSLMDLEKNKCCISNTAKEVYSSHKPVGVPNLFPASFFMTRHIQIQRLIDKEGSIIYHYIGYKYTGSCSVAFIHSKFSVKVTLFLTFLHPSHSGIYLDQSNTEIYTNFLRIEIRHDKVVVFTVQGN